MADRYWVGGTGTWSSASTSNWSAASAVKVTAVCSGAGTNTLTITSIPSGTIVAGMTVFYGSASSLGTISFTGTGTGGTGTYSVSAGVSTAPQDMSAATNGATVPTAADNVIFDANSNQGINSFTVTMATTPRVCNDFTASGLTGTMTLAGTGIGLTVSGSLTFPATNFTRTYTGTTTFNATTTGKTVTTNGVAFGGHVTFNGVGGAWVLGSALTISSVSDLTITAGTFDTSASNYAVTCGNFFSTGSVTRSILLNASTVTLNLSTWNLAATNLTFNSGTSNIVLTYSLITFTGGGFTYYNVSTTFGDVVLLGIDGANTFNNFSIGSRTVLGVTPVTFSANQIINGTFTIGAGTTAAYRTQLASGTIGTPRTLTVNAISSLTDIDFRDITIARTITFNTPGAATWTVPAGVTSATIKLWGGGGGSGGDGYIDGGGGGGGGAYASKVLTVTPTQVLSFTVGVGGAAGGYNGFGQTVGATGGSSTHSTITALGGSGGGDGVGGAGGTASGGDVNTSGQAGIYGGSPIYSNGGLAGNNPNAAAASAVVPYSGLQPGGGQRGGGGDFAGKGGDGRVTFEWSAISSPVTGTRLGDCKGNSGITFPAAKTVYYRQTGSANWSTSGLGSWSATSGGAFDATMFPLAQDTAVFPAAYPASGSTVTLNSSLQYPNNIGTIDMSLRTSDTMTLATSTYLPFIYGNWINGTGITISGTGIITFAGRTTQQITSAGRSFTQPITINSPSGSVTLQDALTTGTTVATNLTNGTLDIQSYTLSTGLFSSSSTNTRTIAFGTGNITCTGTGTVWTTASVTGLTTTGTQVVNVTSTGSTAITVLTGALSEANSISFNFTGGTYGLGFLGISGYTARSVNFTGFSGLLSAMLTPIIYGNLTLAAGMTLTSYIGAVTFGATSGTQQITTNGKTIPFPVIFAGAGGTFQLQDALTIGSTRTTTLSSGTLNLQSFTLSTGLFSSSTTNTRMIAFGTGQISCTGTGTVWDTTTVTGLFTTGTQVVNVTSTGSTAITVSTGALSEVNSISYNFTGGTYALTFLDVTNYSVRNVDFTGFSGTLGEISDPGQAPAVIYGNLTLSATMTLTASVFGNGLSFKKTSGTSNITTNGKVIPFILAFNGVGGTFVLQDNLTTSGVISDVFLVNGTLDLNGKTLTPGSTFATGTGTKNLTFNGGTLVCPTAAVTAFNNAVPTGFTTTAGTGTGTISMTAATAKTFVGGGSTFNCTLNQGGAGALTITGSNIFSNITNTVQPASVLFAAATISTFTNFNLSGTAGNLITIGSVTAASHTISKTSGTVSVSFCSISNSNATGGATWQALTTNGNVDGGNNTGWNFVDVIYVIYGSRITNTGILYTPIDAYFDEITLAKSSITPNVTYSSTFDEVTLQGQNIAKRETSTGQIQVSGYLDEVTGIS